MSFVAVVLAAGSARRFGGDKLSALFRGEPLINHAIRAARAAPVTRVLVVCRPELELGDWPCSPGVEPIRIRSNALSASLKAGLAAAGEGAGAFVFLGDMPLVPHGVAGVLAEVIGEGFAAVPQHGGRNGHPVLLAARAYAEVAGLVGDEGAGRLLRRRGDVAFVAVSDPAILLDVDTPGDLAALAEGRLPKP